MKRYAFPIALAAIIAVASVAVFGFGLDPLVVSGGVAMVMADAAPAGAAELEAAIKKLNETNDEVKRTAESFQKQMAESGTVTKELREQADKNLQGMTTIAQQIADIEQKLARAALDRHGPAAPRSAGALFVANDETVKALKLGFRGRHRVEVPREALGFGMDTRADVTSFTGSAGPLLNPYLIPGMIELPRRRLTIRNLISQGRTNTNAFKYVKESGFTNNAAVVSETRSKPYSDMTFESVTGNVSTIAHLMKASNQILADFPAMQSIIDSRMRYGLALEEEEEILRGDGTGEHLLGLIPSATDFAPAFSPEHKTRLDELRLAILQVYLSQFPADGIVIHPTTWAIIETSKDTTGRYIIGNPQGTLGPRLWGLPVVESLALQVHEFLVGAFQLAAQIFDRQDATVEVSTENDKDFEKNMVTIRAEERLALAVYREEAIVYGNFSVSS